ncbi:hypothetical protein BC940DRAFT_366916 [Gongronella butleri]|nr:hypothetical protein BC940DRAFT_366916 [Gongronella butleri]
MSADSQSFRSISPQNIADIPQHRGPIDPSWLFDPGMLSPAEQVGFHLLFPDWHEKSILDRPTIRDMQRTLKDVNLVGFTKRSVFLADTALTPFDYAPSVEKDSTQFQTFSRVTLDDQKNSLSTDTAVTISGRTFNSRQGPVTIMDIIGVADYLGGCVAASSSERRWDFEWFLSGLMATRLQDMQFNFAPNEHETLSEILREMESNNKKQVTKKMMDDILAAIRSIDIDRAFDMLVINAGYGQIHHSRGKKVSLSEAHELYVKLIRNWLAGDSLQYKALIIKIAGALFGSTYIESRELDAISLDQTVNDAVTLWLFGKATTHKTTTIPFSPVKDMLFIYGNLCGTTRSFKLAIEMGIIDYDDFSAFQNATIHYSQYLCAEAVTSQHGYEYAKLCRDFYSWRQRIKLDFSNSLTRDAFAVLVTITALIVSLTGVIQVIQGFVLR